MADTLTVAREDIEAFNAADWDHLKELYAADAVYEEAATGRVYRGPEEIAEANVAWKRAFPDAKGTVTSEAVADDTVTLDAALPQPGRRQGGRDLQVRRRSHQGGASLLRHARHDGAAPGQVREARESPRSAGAFDVGTGGEHGSARRPTSPGLCHRRTGHR